MVPSEKRFATFLTAVVDEQDAQLAAITHARGSTRKAGGEDHRVGRARPPGRRRRGAHCAVHCKAGKRVTSMCSDDGRNVHRNGTSIFALWRIKLRAPLRVAWGIYSVVSYALYAAFLRKSVDAFQERYLDDSETAFVPAFLAPIK